MSVSNSINCSPTSSTVPGGTGSSFSPLAYSSTGSSSNLVSRDANGGCTLQAYRPINTQTGTTYTLVIGDAGKMITLNNGSAITLTVPLNSSVAFPTGTEIDLIQLGAGQVSVSATGGVTINSVASQLKLSAQYAGGTLKKIGTDTWVLVGSLSA